MDSPGGNSSKTSYDSIAGIYLDHISKPSSWNNIYERPYMISVFDSFQNKNILDIGCGSGFYTLFALKQNASVTAVDASREMLDYISRQTLPEKLKLIRSDLSGGLPFIDNESVDYIICSLILHYFETWDGIVSEFSRVLKNGGKIYISTHHPFADYLHLKKASYFDKTSVEDTWGLEDKPFKVHYFTRPLTDIIRPFLRPDLKILNIEEPLPDAGVKEINEGAYRRLLKKPAFLFLTIEKNR